VYVAHVIKKIVRLLLLLKMSNWDYRDISSNIKLLSLYIAFCSRWRNQISGIPHSYPSMMRVRIYYSHMR